MTPSLSFPLADGPLAVFERLAEKLRSGVVGSAATPAEEALRRQGFAHVEFRDSVCGRQAYAVGTSLAAWEIVMVAQSYGMDTTETAHHLALPVAKVAGVLDYYREYPVEIDAAIEENDAMEQDPNPCGSRKRG